MRRIMFVVFCSFFPSVNHRQLIVRYVLLVKGEDKSCWLSFLFPFWGVRVLCRAVDDFADTCSSA